MTLTYAIKEGFSYERRVRKGAQSPLADAGPAARLLSRLRGADDGGGAGARARRALRLRLHLCARSRYRRAPSRRRLDARLVPDLSARRRMGRIRSDQRHCRQSRSHPRRRGSRRPPGRSAVRDVLRQRRRRTGHDVSVTSGNCRTRNLSLHDRTFAQGRGVDAQPSLAALSCESLIERQSGGNPRIVKCSSAPAMTLRSNVPRRPDAACSSTYIRRARRDLRSPDVIAPIRICRARLSRHFGNRVTRVEVPPGLVTFSNRFLIDDSGEPDETPPDTRIDADRAASRRDAGLSRFRAAIATATSWPISPGRHLARSTGGYRRVQAICDFVHAKIRFSYPDARATRCASDSLRKGRRVPRFRPSGGRAVPVHEHPGALLHRLSRRHRRAGRSQSDGFQRAGSRSISTGAGTRSTPATTIRASAASSWGAAATRRTCRSRRPSASPIWCASKW